MILWRENLGHLLTLYVVKSTHKGYNYLSKIEHRGTLIEQEYFYSQGNAIGWCYQRSEELLRQALRDCVCGIGNL